MGPAYRQRDELSHVPVRRVPRDQVEGELNRFQEALGEARRQLEELRERLSGRVPEDHSRILDTHQAYLKDSVFLSDVENLILSEQLALESAIAKVILDFDRIFRLVENEHLRERAVDLRDVGVRVLRSLAQGEDPERESQSQPQHDHIIVARELSIVDIIHPGDSRVLGVVTEAGSLTSHAAILARSLAIPTLAAIDGLLDEVADGDFLILDAAEGVLRVRPEEVVREQFARAASAAASAVETIEAARTADGHDLAISACCGNLPEVEAARAAHLDEIGLYRTELLYLMDSEPPSQAALVAHYSAVLEAAGGRVVFRLLDLDSGMGASYVHPTREPNPQLGRMGTRALLEKEPLLRTQICALLRAAEAQGADREALAIAVPKVVDCGELRRVKEVLFEEHLALKREGAAVPEPPIGVVLETPASILGAEALAREADFLVLGLDSAQQYLLAADREVAELAPVFECLHPTVVNAVAGVVAAAERAQKPLSVFGVTAGHPPNVTLLVGLGLSTFALAPGAAGHFRQEVSRIDLEAARRQAEIARRAHCSAEMAETLADYGPE